MNNSGRNNSCRYFYAKKFYKKCEKNNLSIVVYMRSQIYILEGRYKMKNDKVLHLFDEYANDLYRFAVSYVGISHEAEDIVQNLFLKLLTKNIILSKKSEKSYLLKMTANMCKDYLKSKRATTSIGYDEVGEILSVTYSFVDKEKQLYEILMKLPETQRVPIYLHFYEGYTYKEIAKILKVSESAVAMRISRGKDELKKKLEE